MAICEQGYLCAVCGQDVEEIAESDLYLRFVLGEVEADLLDRLPERHIRCNPIMAQFIVTESFASVVLDGPFSKANLDSDYVTTEEKRVTTGYLRLLEVTAANVPIWDYPLHRLRQDPAAPLFEGDT